MPDNINPLGTDPDEEEAELIPDDLVMADEAEAETPEEAIDIADLEQGAASQIRAFGAGARASARELRAEEGLKRPLNVTGHGATRSRSFHSKLNDAALALMDKAVNEWVDESGMEIKCVSSCIGIFEGKKPEPHVILTVLY